jgi:hypothetical protein
MVKRQAARPLALEAPQDFFGHGRDLLAAAESGLRT